MIAHGGGKSKSLAEDDARTFFRGAKKRPSPTVIDAEGAAPAEIPRAPPHALQAPPVRDGPRSPSDISVFEIFDLAVQDRGDVETAGHLAAQQIAIAPRDLAVALFLLVVHRLGGQPMVVRRARFDLDETVGIPLEGDDIRLAVGGDVVAFEDAVAVPFEIFYGEFFSRSSKNFFTKVFL